MYVVLCWCESVLRVLSCVMLHCVVLCDELSYGVCTHMLQLDMWMWDVGCAIANIDFY